MHQMSTKRGHYHQIDTLRMAEALIYMLPSSVAVTKLHSQIVGVVEDFMEATKLRVNIQIIFNPSTLPH